MTEIDLEELKKSKTIRELLEFGIINIDKSTGPTSFTVSEFIKRYLGLRKTSHLGTLDPQVTGVLPVALNRACKLTGFFLGEDKEYVGIMRMHEEVSIKEIEKVISEKFLGIIKQLPPVKSRVKREEREREIKTFELLEKSGKDILFKSNVQGGTYIRKLIHDLGEEMKIGAHMLELRRIRAGIFSEDDKDYPVVSLYDFEKAVKEFEDGNEKSLRKMIIPGEIISKLYPIVQVDEKEIFRLYTGKPFFDKALVNKADLKLERGEKINVFSGNKFIGVYNVVKEEDLFAKPEFVLQPIKK